MQLIEIDVSDLEPPEPMTAILFKLSVLTHEQCLLVKHRRQPFPLYEKLHSAGFLYHCNQIASDNIYLYIYHRENKQKFKLFAQTQPLIKGLNLNDNK